MFSQAIIPVAGYGKWGTPQSMITLNSTDQVLVSGIKSGISGDGAPQWLQFVIHS